MAPIQAVTQLPTRPTGGSLRGWSYYSTWGSCEWKAWLRYHFRPPEAPPEIAGAEQRLTPRPLLVGSLFHEGIAGYYASGWDHSRGVDTGAYSPEAGAAALADHADSRATEWANETEREADLSDALGLLARYHQYYGPAGPACDYPAFRVAAWHDPISGTPVPAVELELAIDLGEDLLFTSRFDAVFIDEHGALWGLEHKTSAASRVHALFQRAYLDGQVTGQWANLCAHFAPLGHTIGGVALNVVVKDAGKGKPPFQRKFYHRDQLALDTFVRTITRRARHIDRSLAEIDARAVATGETPYQAALATLDTLPPSDQCFGFGKCDFYDLCLDRALGERILAGGDFVARRKRDLTTTEGQ